MISRYANPKCNGLCQPAAGIHTTGIFIIIAILFLISVNLQPGRAQAQENPTPTIRATTSEILLDFVVRDKHEHIIKDLRPDEVQVLEDGVPQSLKHFEFFDGHEGVPGAAGQPAPASLGAASPANAGAARPANSNAARPTNPSAATPATVNELRDMSVVSVVIANLDPRERKLTIDAMREFVKNELKPNTYVGIFSLGMGGLRFIQPYTNDGEKIAAAVEHTAQSAMLSQIDPISSLSAGKQSGLALEDCVPGDTSFRSCPGGALTTVVDTHWVNELHDVYTYSQMQLTPLRTLVQAQATIPGRKVLLLFMYGLNVHPDNYEMYESVISAANRANVTIYAISSNPDKGYGKFKSSAVMLNAAADASRQQQLAKINGGDMSVTPTEAISMDLAVESIHANTVNNLADLSEATGGRLIPDTLDMREPLREAMEGVRTHFELSYSPSNMVVDGSFRKIEVRVTRPGAKVFARSGYYAVPVLNGHQLYPFEVGTMRALNTKPDLHQFDFHAATIEFRPGAARNQYAYVFQAPTRDLMVTTDATWAKVHVCVTALIKDEKGEVVDKISKDIPYNVPIAKKAELEQGTVSFTAPFYLAPGQYTVETATVDRNSMKASVSRSTLEVKPESEFAMSDVVLARRVDETKEPANALDPLQAHGGTVTPELTDLAKPAADGKVTLYAIAYPQMPVEAPLTMSLEIWKNNQLVMKSPAGEVKPDASGAASVLASFPTAKFAAGEYEARITFQYKGANVTKKTAFRLMANN